MVLMWPQHFALTDALDCMPMTKPCVCLPASHHLQAISSLGYVPDDVWLTDFFAHTRRAMRLMDPSELVALASALARMQRKPDEPWWRDFYAAARACFRALPPQAHAALLPALASLACKPEAPWLKCVASSAYADQ